MPHTNTNKEKKMTKHTCCDGECNHDDCCGKVAENCPNFGKTSSPDTLIERMMKEFNKEFKESISGGDWNDYDYVIECIKPFLDRSLSSIKEAAYEEERKRIDQEITEQFKYAHIHNNYDIRGIDWSTIIHPKSQI